MKVATTYAFTKVIFATLALVAPLRLAIYLFTNGENIGSNDDFIFITNLDKMLRLSSNFSGDVFSICGNYFNDTFINDHCFAFGQLLFNLFALSSGLNQYVGIGIALILIGVRLFLLHHLLFAQSPNWQKWLALPFLSALLFAPSATGILSQASLALIWQFSLTLSAFTIWAIFKSPKKRGISLASLALLINSYTLAAGLATIPIVWGVTLCRRQCRDEQFSFLSFSTLLAFLPYIVHINKTTDFSQSLISQLHPPQLLKLVDTLGLTFAQGSGTSLSSLAESQTFGFLGLFLFALLCLTKFLTKPQASDPPLPPLAQPNWQEDKEEEEEEQEDEENYANYPAERWQLPAPALPPIPAWNISLTLAFYGLLCSCSTIFTKDILSPGFSQLSAFFWLGLMGMALSLLQDRPPSKPRIKSLSLQNINFPLTVSFSTLACILSLLLYSPSFDDKQVFLDNRSPIYVAILRNYENPPPVSSYPPYKLSGLTPKQLAPELEKHKWPPFNRVYQAQLQGDMAIPHLVHVSKTKSTELLTPLHNDLDWIVGDKPKEGETPLTYKSFKRLNLVLPDNRDIHWHVALPYNTGKATFQTKILATGKRQRSPGIGGKGALKSNQLMISVECQTEKSPSPFRPLTFESSNCVTCQLEDHVIANSLQKPVIINLTKYAGRTILLSLHHPNPGRDNVEDKGENENDGYEVLESPRIIIEQF